MLKYGLQAPKREILTTKQ